MTADNRKPTPTELQTNQVTRLALRAHRASRAHYLAVKSNTAMHNRLGVPVVCTSAAISTAIFSTLVNSPSVVAITITGLASAAVAVLSALQTFFGFASRAEKHRASAAQYAGIKRELDLLRLQILTDVTPERNYEKLGGLIARVNQVEEAAPPVKDALYDQARTEQVSDAEGI